VKGHVKYPELQDRAWFEQHYLKNLESAKEIADSLGCSRATITLALRRHEIATIPPLLRKALKARRDKQEATS